MFTRNKLSYLNSSCIPLRYKMPLASFLKNEDASFLFSAKVSGPYEFLNHVSKELDGQVKKVFGDKAIYIEAIAKVRAVTDASVDEAISSLRGSAFTNLFESFDPVEFFSSLDRKEILNFLQSYSATACFFISAIRDTDLKNRAIVDVRSKLNSLVSSSREEGDDQIWSFFNLLSIIYYSDIIKFLLSKMAYSTCYACQLFNMASNLVYFDDGINGGKDISLGSLKEKKFLEDLNVLRTKYA